MTARDRLLRRGYSVTDMLYQDRVWRQGSRMVPLETLGTRHLRNILNWLLERAESLSFAADAVVALHPHARDDVPLITDEYPTARAWLEDTPLVERLQELLEVDDYARAMAACGPEAT